MRSPPTTCGTATIMSAISPLAKDQDRLTVAENWAQIGRQADGILHFLSSWRLFGNSIHVRLIAAFASKGDRDPSQARDFCSARFRDRSCLVRPGANGHPSANPDANVYQLRFVGGRSRDPS